MRQFDFFNESVEADLSWPIEPGSFIPDIVYKISSQDFLKSCKNEIWKLIQDSYSSSGGYKGHDNVRSLIKDTHLAKFVFSDDGSIKALSLYTTRSGGNKRFCSAKNFDIPNSTQSVNLIVKDDISDLEGHYWVETSGGIEHIFAKFHGDSISNYLAKEILGVKSELTLDPDGIHYVRPIGTYHDKLKKMIFGFKDKATAIRVCSAVANYEDFKLKTCAELIAKGLAKSDDNDFDIKWAYAVVNHLEILKTEWQCRELLPEWIKTMNEAKDILVKSKDKSSRTIGCIDYINNSLKDIPRLTVKKI